MNTPIKPILVFGGVALFFMAIITWSTMGTVQAEPGVSLDVAHAILFVAGTCFILSSALCLVALIWVIGNAS